MAIIQTILIIEDDRFIGEMYVRSLRNNGYTVDWTTTGHEGADAATSRAYDLILLDIMLPEVPGTELLKDIRDKQSLGFAAKSRIIVLTNFDQDEASRAAMEAEADAYLIKADITPRKLIEIIRTMTAVEPPTSTTEPHA